MSEPCRDRRIRFLVFSAILALTLSLGGCATASAGLATSNIPLDGRKYTVLGTAETVRKWYTFDVGFFGMPLKDPPIDEAVQDLLKAKGGDALINLRYFTDRSIYLFITQHRFYLKAEVVKLNSGSPAPAP